MRQFRRRARRSAGRRWRVGNTNAQAHRDSRPFRSRHSTFQVNLAHLPGRDASKLLLSRAACLPLYLVLCFRTPLTSSVERLGPIYYTHVLGHLGFDSGRQTWYWPSASETSPPRIILKLGSSNSPSFAQRSCNEKDMSLDPREPREGSQDRQSSGAARRR